MPGGEVVGVLPEIEHMLAEFVGVHGAVEKAVSVVALHEHYLGFGFQIGLGLCLLEGIDPCLQRHLCTHKFRVRIGFRAPVFDVFNTVSRKAGLCGRLFIWPGIGRLNGK